VFDCSENKNKNKISLNDLDFSKLLLLEEGHCLRTQVIQICELFEKSPKNDLNIDFKSGSMGSLIQYT